MCRKVLSCMFYTFPNKINIVMDLVGKYNQLYICILRICYSTSTLCSQFTDCTYQLLLFCPAVPAVDPCNPSPCGPNSVCRVNNGVAVCSCQPSYVGSPPACRPECVVSAECPLTQACLASKCRDPCPGTCGQNARCQVVNHNPICSCSPGNTGDPFRQCFPIPGKIWASSKQLS